MAEKANGTAPEPSPMPVPEIVISFAGPLSAEATVRAERVSPGQLFLAAWLLDALAHEVRAGEVAKAAMTGIVGAPVDMLAQLRRAGRI